MFEDSTKKATTSAKEKKDLYFNNLKKMQRNMAVRFLDMQSVVNGKLAGSQQSVNNAENYPSTWTTNPDGGANGQV